MLFFPVSLLPSHQSIIFPKTTSALFFHSHFLKDDYFITGFQEAFVMSGTALLPYKIYNSLHLRLHCFPHPTFPWSFLSKPLRLRFCSQCSNMQQWWIMSSRENLVFIRDLHRTAAGLVVRYTTVYSIFKNSASKLEVSCTLAWCLRNTNALHLRLAKSCKLLLRG